MMTSDAYDAPVARVAFRLRFLKLLLKLRRVDGGLIESEQSLQTG